MKVCIKDLPYKCRPLSRALQVGVGALTNNELLSLATGSDLHDFDFEEIMKFDIADLRCLGLSPTAAARTAAVMEFSKRLWRQVSVDADELRSPDKLATYVREELCHEEQEQFWLLCFDARLRPIKENILTIGTFDSTVVSVRDTLIHALRCNAISIAVAHNHPGCASAQPSEEDIRVTKSLSEACKLVGIKFTDHIIISGNGGWYSFRESGLICLK